MRWGRILLAAIGVPLVGLLLITVAATGYAFKLAFAVQGPPDSARIGQFAGYLGSSFGWILQALLTVPAAAWAAWKVKRARRLHGALVGLLVALMGFAMGFVVSLQAIAAFALTVGAGWFGAVLVRRRTIEGRDGPARD